MGVIGVKRISRRSERRQSSDAGNQVLVQSTVVEVLQVLSARTTLQMSYNDPGTEDLSTGANQFLTGMIPLWVYLVYLVEIEAMAMAVFISCNQPSGYLHQTSIKP